MFHSFHVPPPHLSLWENPIMNHVHTTVDFHAISFEYRWSLWCFTLLVHFRKKMECTEPPSGKSAHTDFPLQPVDHLLLVESTVDRPLQGWWVILCWVMRKSWHSLLPQMSEIMEGLRLVIYSHITGFDGFIDVVSHQFECHLGVGVHSHVGHQDQDHQHLLEFQKCDLWQGKGIQTHRLGLLYLFGLDSRDWLWCHLHRSYCSRKVHISHSWQLCCLEMTSLDESGVGTLKLGSTWASNTSVISLVPILSTEVSKTPTENVFGTMLAMDANAAEWLLYRRAKKV